MAIKAGIVVFDNLNKQILTISNQFDANIGLPKGSIEYNESSYNAAFRELYEETGLKFDNKPAIQSKFYNNRCNCEFFIIYMPNGSQTKIDWKLESENIYNVKWRTLDELIENKQLLNFTFKSSKNVIIKRIYKLFT